MKSSRFVGVLCIALVCLSGTLRGAPDQAMEKLQAIAPGGDVEVLDPGQHKVLRWVEDAQADDSGEVKWRQQEVQAKAIYRAAQQYFIEIEAPWTQPSSRPADQRPSLWLTGWVAGGKEINCSTVAYASLEELVDAASYAKLPVMPGRWEVREVAQMPSAPVRLASDGTGRTLFVLGQNGDVWQVEIATGKFTEVLRHQDYLPQGGNALGMAFDVKQKRLFIVVNRHDTEARPEQNHVTIFRTASVQNDVPAEPQEWLTTSYPYGVNTFNHGVSYIAFGPDGMLYVNSGSRTDHGELGEEPNIARIPGGETARTACIWRLDPNVDAPEIEVFARGIRNAFGFTWDDRGRMLATENGPNADAPEELNLIEPGGHYGFPFQFSDWEEKAYPDQPDAPPELAGKLRLPIVNIGPDGRGDTSEPLSTLEAHSCPAGVVFLDKSFPEEFRGSFLVVRFGNFIGPRDTGFDVLQVRLHESPGPDSRQQATVETFLAPVARPLDIHLSGGKIYICENTRQVSNTGPQLPGRVIEVAVKR